ncbi:MAG: HD domain-containing protein [Candidatus Methylomirabilales bacterium]
MTLSCRFQDGLTFAVELHDGQPRKGTSIPYISHLLGVASLVLDNGADEDEAIAALLHDAIEDQGGSETREEIRRRFGDRVVEIVDGCSDTDSTPKPPWLERKKAYLTHLRNACASVLLVSAADTLHNARAILTDYRELGESLWERFNGGREGTLWYYRSVVTAFRGTAAAPLRLVEELDQVVSEIEGLASSGKSV